MHAYVTRPLCCLGLSIDAYALARQAMLWPAGPSLTSASSSVSRALDPLQGGA